MICSQSSKPVIAVAQLEVAPGRPDLNTQKILQEIQKARKRAVDVIIFSEMVVPGYLLGDEWENDSFIRDVEAYNEDIRLESKDITVVWGSVYADWNKKGEDGRVRKYNAAYIAQNKKWITNGVFDGHTYKTLMPKYREFDDERHFYSMVKYSHESQVSLKNLLIPFPVTVKNETIQLGLMLCEDMWCDDYADNPLSILVDNGAELIVNISCSPWTWRKNDKRHRVVKSLLEKNPVPLIYCNNVGIQNNGKNIFLFDGNSTVYNADGSISVSANDYKEETIDITINNAHDSESQDDDMAELYNGLIYGIEKFFDSLPTNKVVIGLSGGVDSAVCAVLLSEALSAENVYAVNMPSQFNSELTRGAAAELAKNLGIHYAVFPIQESVDKTVTELEKCEFVQQDTALKVTKLEVTPFVIENIQARDRGSRVLAAIAAALGAIFTNNGNKTETALGYATLYGDVNGAIAPIADLYKGQVYELAKYMNTHVTKDVIPSSILTVVPSAELSAEQDVEKGKGDPINYPYHDKLLRAFIEFRRDPEYILSLYKDGTLEEELALEKGLLKHSFATKKAFIDDLERMWKLYKINYFKRIQAPPIIAVSKRAFGFDLREAQNGVYFTKNYQALKEKMLS